jgi:hypothetical protein
MENQAVSVRIKQNIVLQTSFAPELTYGVLHIA